MSATAAGARQRAQPHTQRRSLRALRFQSNLPRYALFVIALAVVWLVARSATGQPPPAPPLPAPGVNLPAQSFAVAFTRAYLTYSAAEPQEHERQLAPYLDGSAAVDQDADVELPASGSDQVRFAQVASSHPGAGGTTYIVQADTSADGTLYLAVTAARSPSGAIRLVGTPAIVGPPPVAAATQDPSQTGEQVTDPAVTTVVRRALRNYLRGNTTDLQSDLATGTSITTPGISLSQIQIGQINWLTEGRSVGVEVQATDRSGATYDLHYTLFLKRQAAPGGSRWFITGIQTTSS